MNISNNNGYLRLRFTHNGQRYSLSFGIKDTKSNRLKAQKVALQIEADMEQGAFDSSLQRYQSLSTDNSVITCKQLLDRWLDYKSNFVSLTTIKWYESLSYHFLNLAKDSSTDLVQPLKVLSYLRGEKLRPETIKRIIENLKACWNWGLEKGLTKSNPWGEIVDALPKFTKDAPKPFSKEEINGILEITENRYPELLSFTKFVLATGCRLGEARALKWNAVSKDCRVIDIQWQMTRQGMKAPKANRFRKIYPPDSITEMLLSMPRRKGFVFEIEGEAIDEGYFYRRWRRILHSAGISYRKPYNCRHTFVSHALEKGVPPAQLAEQTGHSQRVMYEHYVAGTTQRQLPEII